MALLIEENDAAGITGSKFQSGINDIDPGTLVESGFTLPYVIDKATSWLDYRCTLAIDLDPGVVVHKVLPQVAQDVDTLASATFEAQAKKVTVQVFNPNQGVVSVTKFVQGTPYEKQVGQANTVSAGKFTDFVQRMATSTYRFCLKGWAIRAGHRIPIPGLQTVCGIPAIPAWPQKVLSDSEVVANYSGVPIFFAQWELWYIVSVPPTKAQTPPPNVAEHITADATLPDGMQAPLSPTDALAVQAAPAAPKLKLTPALRQP